MNADIYTSKKKCAYKNFRICVDAGTKITEVRGYY